MKIRLARSGRLAGGFGLLLALALTLTLYPVYADMPPQMPHQFYGSVTVGNQPAPQGTVISARVGGVEYLSTTVDAQGRYGYNPLFKFPADDLNTPLVKEGGVDGDTIQFFVNGQVGGEHVFQSGSPATALDLSVPGGIQLNPGWNLISLPVIPQNTAIGPLFQAQPFIQIATYLNPNPPSPQSAWTFYNSSGPSDLTAMRDGVGYWVNMSSQTPPGTALCVTGYAIARPGPNLPPSYSVATGWNLIGFKEQSPQRPDQYLAGIAGKHVMIYGFAGGSFFVVGTPGHEYLQP